MSGPPRDAIRMIQVLLPIVVGIIGVAGVTRASEIRERYQWVADLVLAVSVIAIILAIVAALYPIALDRPFRFFVREVRRLWSARLERQSFNRWVEKWSEYSDLVLRDLERRETKRWIELQPEYEALREWLIESASLLPRGVTQHVLRHLFDQWDTRSHLEDALRGVERGFFPFYRHLEFDLQIVDMLSNSQDKHLSHTLASIWDGLSRYSADRGWGRLRPRGWRKEPSPHPEVTQGPASADED